MEKIVDVAIIGAGSAGLSAMSVVRRFTSNFVLIDGGELGTTCARVGCMPSKALIQVAEDFHRRHHLARIGVAGGDQLALEVEDSLEHVRDLRDIFVDRVLEGTTDQMGEEFMQGQARFLEPGVLQVGEDIVRAGAVVIATGSRPQVPAAWQAFGDRVLTSDNLFEQEDLPGSVAVIGLGVIGMEIGQALQRLGVAVTGIDQLDTVGGLTDPVVAREALTIFGKEFPLWLGQPAVIEQHDNGLLVRAGEREVTVERLLVSIGRTPAVSGLGLENLGVELDARGLPVYDPLTLQIGDLPVFMAGDVNGQRPILHEAGDEGRMAGYNAASGEVRAFRRKTPLMVTFTDPNIALVGHAWSDGDEDRLCSAEIRFGPLGRALIMGKNRGILRLYADRDTAKLRGASIVSVRGEHLAHLLAWSIEQGMTVHDLVRMPYYHPTIEEAVQAVARDLQRQIGFESELPPDLTPAT